jgi:PhoPQ-activated pathogenicity-related protein
MAIELGDIMAELNQVPNQPLVFAGETEGRVEDGILAKGWDMFITSRDPLVVSEPFFFLSFSFFFSSFSPFFRV